MTWAWTEEREGPLNVSAEQGSVLMKLDRVTIRMSPAKAEKLAQLLLQFAAEARRDDDKLP